MILRRQEDDSILKRKASLPFTSSSIKSKKSRNITTIPLPFPSPNVSGNFNSLQIPVLKWKELNEYLAGNFKRYQIFCGFEDRSIIQKWHFSIKEKNQEKSTNIIGIVEADCFQFTTFHYQDREATGYLLSAICLYWLSPEAQKFIGHPFKDISLIKYEPCVESSERTVNQYFKKQLNQYFHRFFDGSFHLKIKEQN